MRLSMMTGLAAATAALAACAPPPSTTVVIEPPVQTACLAADYQQYVGQKSPAISLPAGTEYRHYRTGDALTEDANPARLNFEYDRTGKLVKVSCG